MKIILPLVLVFVLVALVVGIGSSSAGKVPLFVDWVRAQGSWGPVIFVAGYALAAVVMLPGSLLTLAGGAVFGLAKGVGLVFLGAVTGASLAFLIARYLARRFVERRITGHPGFAAIDETIGRDGRKIVFLLRLSPVFPFSLLNYALGLTRVRFADYLLASVGMLPGTLLYVYYGKLAGDVAALAGGRPVPHGLGYWAVLGLGLVATIVVSVLVTRTARRALASATGPAQ